ncbi:ribonuclease Z [Sutcliffiella cohnii]
MKITFLGTGSGVPAKHRNVSSLALHLMNKEGAIWLFDCGEATQHQILHTSIKPRKIEKIFISHLHGDHIFGLPGLLGSRSFQGGESPLHIYGPTGTKEYVDTSLRISGTHLKYDLTIQEFSSDCLLLEGSEFTVQIAELIHGIPSYGFRIMQKDFPAPLLMNRIKEANIKAGPILGEIKAGKIVTLPDGRVVDGKDFLGEPKKGKIVTILGDTRFTDKAISLAQNANTLVHEATFAKEDKVLAHEYFHSTTEQAATVAKEANVEQLLLNHISSRYQKEAVQQLELEAREIFPSTYIVEDLSSFDIP